jgi:hypothetical protein
MLIQHPGMSITTGQSAVVGAIYSRLRTNGRGAAANVQD